MTTRTYVIAGAIALATVMGFTGNALAQSPSTPAPVMNEELMGRLIKYTRAVSETGSIAIQLCAVFKLCDGTNAMPMKVVKSDLTDAEHLFSVPLNADSKDILIMVDHFGILYAYLADKTGKLRAAAISDKTGARLIPNEKAEEGFKAELAIFAKEAEQLPPTK